MSYTETQLLQVIHRIYSGNTSYPASTEEDYLLRRGYANDAIVAWADNQVNGVPVRWRELFVNLSSASTGTKTTTASTGSYAMPTDFLMLSSLVSVGGVYYTFVENDKVMDKLRQNSSDQFFYITGNPSTGYYLNINPTPTVSSLTISYSYYKQPTLLTTTSTVAEMSKPYFIVYYVVARLHEQDLRNDLVNFYEDRMKALMDDMIIDNSLPPEVHPFVLEDFDNAVNGVAFGE